MTTALDRLFGVNDALARKAPVRVATTGNLAALSGLLIVDGVQLSEGDRVLVKDQGDQTQNGIRVASSGLWVLATDFDGTRDVVLGTSVLVGSGLNNGGMEFFVSAPLTGTISPGVTRITFAKSAGSAAATASASSVALVGASYQISRVPGNRIVNGPDGKRFVIKGVTFADALFASYDWRGKNGVATDWRYRNVWNEAAYGPATGVAGPTHYASDVYQSAAHVDSEVRAARNLGVNTLRIGVDPACFYTKSYLDADGNTYPSDIELLDTYISTAARYGMVVILINAIDLAPLSIKVELMKNLAAKYWLTPNVWIHVSNELHSFPIYNSTTGQYDTANPDLNNVALNTSDNAAMLAAVRAQIPGLPAGSYFANPVLIGPTNYSSDLASCSNAWIANATINSDPNLLVDVHFYPHKGEADFTVTPWLGYSGVPGASVTWFQYIDYWAVLVGETGINNNLGRYDPNFNSSITLASDAAYQWPMLQAEMIDFLTWASNKVSDSSLNGVIGTQWYGYSLGTLTHDYNTMKIHLGDYTTWGYLFQRYYLGTRASNIIKGAKNKVINPEFKFNQNGYTSLTAITTTSAYSGTSQPEVALEPWYAGPSGVTLDTSGLTTGNLLKITQGSLCQKVEAVAMDEGTYCLAWVGSAEGSIDGINFGPSPIVTRVAQFQNVTITFRQPAAFSSAGVGATLGKVRFVPGSAAPTFEARSVPEETAMIARYFRSYPAHLFDGYNAAAGAIRGQIPLGAPMWGSPTVSMSNHAPSNAANMTVESRNSTVVRFVSSISATGYGYAMADVKLRAGF